MMNKIRFNGFTQEWKEVKLGEIFINSKEKSEINNQFQFLSVGKFGVTLQSDNFERQIAMENNIGVPILRKNQFVMNPYFLYLGLFKLNKNFENGLVSQAYKVFDYNKKECFLNYLEYLIKSNSLIKKFETISDKGNAKLRRSVKIENFNELEVSIPSSLPEQERIGTFLSNIDRKIELEENKLERLEEYKKGMLHKVFSQEVRFKDENGKVFKEDWKEVKLGDIFDIKTGENIDFKILKNKKDGEFIYPVYSSKTKNGGINGYNKEFLFEDKIIYSTRGAETGTINYIKGKFYGTGLTGVFLEKENNFENSQFISLVLEKQIKGKISGGGIPQLNKSDILPIKIIIPSGILEQERIGKYFENLDKLIEQQKKLIDNNKLFKSSLLQKMF